MDQKLSGLDTGYNISEARQIMDEMQAIQKNLSSGQQEKQDLMQVGDWARKKHELGSLTPRGVKFPNKLLALQVPIFLRDAVN